MTLVVLDLGSNIERESSLVTALEHLADVFSFRAVSSVYRTVPVGMGSQPDFYNLALEIETDKSVEELRAILVGIEDRMGRDRTGPKFGPRNIDIDVVLYGETDDPDNGIPHPQAAAELFVVVPLLDLRPEGVHPGNGRSWKDLRGELMGGRTAKDAGISKQCELAELPLGAKARAALGLAKPV